ncbi:unnamed protein product [Prorocentrum cordatum]|uniref:MARVEL domain-containing protein n=1 Tax=Prorocentrum cordatum TaxID=2364126 RepID=A0ABN9Y315_9DINO|nr:unnamed protein product [Polarella glacialis]
MVQPLSSFCCGCPLEMGVRITLTLHLLSCLFYMATCWLNVVVEAPTLGSDVAMGTQAFNCGFALASLPFVVSGFSGVFYEIEVHLRVYLYWLILTVSMDSVLYAYVLCQNSCAKIPVFLEDVGGAFSCGFMRMAGTLMLASWLVLMGYNAFTVWSLCEELQGRPGRLLASWPPPRRRLASLQGVGGRPQGRLESEGSLQDVGGRPEGDGQSLTGGGPGPAPLRRPSLAGTGARGAARSGA